MSGTDAEQSADLFLEHHERLHRFARQLVGSGGDAEDLVQETFLKAHDYLQNGNVIRAPLSFLFVTVRNLVNDRYRRKTIQLADASIDVDDVVPEDAPLTAERQLMSEREFEALCAAIDRLPERMREVFVLKRIYGYTCREIADQVGTSVETVKKQAAQGFNKLKAERKPPENPKQANGHANGSSRVIRLAPARHHE